MKIDPHEQGTMGWMRARAGIPTASQFHRIITPTTMKLSKSSDTYMHELLAEWMLGEPLGSYLSDYMDRGNDLELAAVRYYEMERDLDVERVGFCLRDDGSAGCSPDGLVGEDVGLEIKVPSPAVHVGYLLSDRDKYKTQVQGCMWVTGRQAWDFLSYHPSLPNAILRFVRDEKFISALEEQVLLFCDRLEAGKRLMVDRGHAEREKVTA